MMQQKNLFIWNMHYQYKLIDRKTYTVYSFSPPKKEKKFNWNQKDTNFALPCNYFLNISRDLKGSNPARKSPQFFFVIYIKKKKHSKTLQYFIKEQKTCNKVNI